MAGSYNHVVRQKTGALLKNEAVCSMLETRSGDVFEAVEEMYGMIWYLANLLEGIYDSEAHWEDKTRASLVEEARRNYREGLRVSPTKRYHGSN